MMPLPITGREIILQCNHGVGRAEVGRMYVSLRLVEHYNVQFGPFLIVYSTQHLFR